MGFDWIGCTELYRLDSVVDSVTFTASTFGYLM